MAAPRFDDLVKQGGQLETEPLRPAPRFDDLVKQAAGGGEGPGLGRDLLTAGLQGFFKGGSDELRGATAPLRYAPGDSIKGKDGLPYARGMEGFYSAARDTHRGELAGARERLGPVAAIGTEIAGDILSDGVVSAIIPGAGGVIASPAGQALEGALSGLLGNDADLTTGSPAAYADAATSTGIGGLLGYALPKLGQKLGAAKFAKAGVQRAEQAAADAATKKTEQAIASKLGEYRSAVQSASRDLEVLEREAASGVGEVAERARAFLKTPEAQALRDMVLGSKLGSAPERIGSTAALKGEHAALVAGKDAAIAAGTEALLEKPVRKQLLPRALTYMSRTVPAMIGSGLGGAVGGVPGALLGTALGGVTGVAMGRPGTAISNAVKSPAVRKAAWEFTDGLATEVPRLAGPMLPTVAREGQRLNPDDERDTSGLSAKLYELLRRR